MIWIGVALFALLVLAAFAVWLTFGLIHLLVTLAVAGLVGWLADLVVPGELPFGWLGAVAAGLVGGWIGGALLGSVGPSLFGVNLIPAFVGAAVLAAAVEVVGKAALRRG